MIGVREATGMNELSNGQNDQHRQEQIEVRLALADPQQFAPLYLRYFDPVYGYCFSRLRDPQRAADATSQVFLKALASLSTYRGGSFRSWLFTIAHNVVVDNARRTKPQSSLPPDWEVPDPQPALDQQVIGRDESRLLWDLLDHLTDDQRLVVELRLAGLTGQEIADQLGKSLPAIKSLQIRAFARLRQLLEHEDEPQPNAKLHSGNERRTS